jgi:hypothetical protein
MFFVLVTQYVLCELRTDYIYRIWFNYRIQEDKHSVFLSHFNKTVNPLTPELNPSAQRCLKRFLLVILLLEPCISLIQGNSQVLETF